MTLEQVDAIAQGRVWSGKKAKELGLVDELGDLTDAVVAAADLASLERYDTLLIEKEQSSRNKFVQHLLGESASFVTLFTGQQHKTLVELASSSNSNEQGISTLINLFKSEFGQISQLNDPQGKYTLCLACSAQ
jgi:protease-4